MPIEQIFIHTTSDGRPFITIHEWVNTLTEEEETEYFLAESRQHAYRQEKIDDGSLTIGEYSNSYIWKDSKTAELGKPNDPVWEAYNNRYIIENKIVSVTKQREI